MVPYNRFLGSLKVKKFGSVRTCILGINTFSSQVILNVTHKGESDKGVKLELTSTLTICVLFLFRSFSPFSLFKLQ